MGWGRAGHPGLLPSLSGHGLLTLGAPVLGFEEPQKPGRSESGRQAYAAARAGECNPTPVNPKMTVALANIWLQLRERQSWGPDPDPQKL